MNLNNELNNDEIKLLKSMNIYIKDKEYNVNELGDIIEALDDAIHNNLNKDLNYTEKAIEIEKIQDKIIDLENKID